mgnify:CR=1
MQLRLASLVVFLPVILVAPISSWQGGIGDGILPAVPIVGPFLGEVGDTLSGLTQ